MSKIHKIKLVQEDPEIENINFNIKYAIIKWVLTIIVLISVGVFFGTKVDKSGLLGFGIFAFLTIFAWYKDIKLFLKRKRKFERNWRFFKDPLMKEFILIVILILIVYWYFFL